MRPRGASRHGREPEARATMAPPAAAAVALRLALFRPRGPLWLQPRRGRPRATNPGPPGAPGPARGSESSDTATGMAAGLRIIIRVTSGTLRPRAAVITRRDSPQCLALAGVY